MNDKRLYRSNLTFVFGGASWSSLSDEDGWRLKRLRNWCRLFIIWQLCSGKKNRHMNIKHNKGEAWLKKTLESKKKRCLFSAEEGFFFYGNMRIFLPTPKFNGILGVLRHPSSGLQIVMHVYIYQELAFYVISWCSGEDGWTWMKNWRLNGGNWLGYYVDGETHLIGVSQLRISGEILMFFFFFKMGGRFWGLISSSGKLIN